MKMGFTLLDNHCYYFINGSDPSAEAWTVTRTYSDTKRICKTAFGPNVIGKIIEPKSWEATDLIREYVVKNFALPPFYQQFGNQASMWIGDTVQPGHSGLLFSFGYTFQPFTGFSVFFSQLI